MECTLCPALLWDLAVSGLKGLCVDPLPFVLSKSLSQGPIALASRPSVTNYTAPVALQDFALVPGAQAILRKGPQCSSGCLLQDLLWR